MSRPVDAFPRQFINGTCAHCGRDYGDDAPAACSDDCPIEEARAAVVELHTAAVMARYSLEWHKKQGHFVGMDGKFLDDLNAALAKFGGAL